MITEKDISIVRQTCIKTSAELVGNAVEYMEPAHRQAVLQNKDSLSRYVIDLAKDFENWINKGLCVLSEEGVKPAPEGESPTVECVNLVVTRGEGKGEKHSTWPYREFLTDLGLVWNPDYQGHSGQLTKEQWEQLKNSDEMLEVTLGKGDKQRKVKFTMKTIFTELLKIREEEE